MDKAQIEYMISRNRHDIAVLKEKLSTYQRQNQKLTETHQRIERVMKRFTDEQDRMQNQLARLHSIKGSEKLAQQVFNDLYKSHCGSSFMQAENGIFETKTRLMSLLQQTDDLCEETKRKIARLEDELVRLKQQLCAFDSISEESGR